ncbi:MAG: fumarylacetoacetate hydrolase family protein [Congregibacter sp.]
MAYVINPAARPACAVVGTDARFPVHRIYCVGRNYAEHAREMGNDPEREPPFFFSKPADAIVANHSDVAYPPATANLHHEVELVVAIGRAGAVIAEKHAQDYVYGYAVGNDLTRRDLQAAAKGGGRPWDTAKGFDQSAPLAPLHPVADFGPITGGAITLQVNGELKQKGRVEDMIWSVPEIISHLSSLYVLQPGDLIFTGTPAGVSALERGDAVEGRIADLTPLVHRVI